MAHFLSYSSELAQMGTDQQEHEQQHPSVQTRSQSSDTRAFLQMNGPQSYPCSQYENENWTVCPQSPGSVMTFPYPDYNPHLSGSGLETYESTRLQVSRPPIGHYCVSSFSSGSPSKRNFDQETFTNWNTESAFASPSFFAQNNFYPRHSSFSQKMIQPEKICLTPSRSISTSPHQSPSQSLDGISPGTTVAANIVGEDNSPRTSFGENSEEEPIAEPPYSTLIYESLKDAPERKKTLQEIYEWFKANTNKDRDPTSKGWQNSIRHNLSMNQGFEAIKIENSQNKSVNYWRLTDEAYTHGIQSTTRYRRSNQRKTDSSDPTTRERRRSGSKAGRGFKTLVKARNSPQYEQRRDQQYEQKPMLHSTFPSAQPHRNPIHSPIRSLPSGTALPYQSSSGPARGNASQKRGLDEVISCTTPPAGNNTVFYGTEGSEPSVFGMGHQGYYGPSPLSPIHGLPASPEITAGLQFV